MYCKICSKPCIPQHDLCYEHRHNKRKPLKSKEFDYLFLTCNCCDRIIYEDELTEEQHNENGGYCPECFKQILIENERN